MLSQVDVMKRTAPWLALGVLFACGGGLVAESGDGGTDVASDRSAIDRAACPAGESSCGGACVNEQTDDHHCGGCEIVCKVGICQSGSCVCPGGETECNGVCVDERTDDTNCGGCGLKCDHCVARHCLTTLATGNFNALALDDTRVYWLDYDYAACSGDAGSCIRTNGKVMSVAKTGGVTTTLASGQVEPIGIAVDDGRVFWTNSGFPGYPSYDGTVLSVAKTGGSVVTLASGQGWASGIAVDATDVYWTASPYDCPDGGGCSVVGNVMRMSKAGGGPTTLAAGNWFLADSSLVLDATDVYWSQAFVVGAVMRVPKGGGKVSTLKSPFLDGLLGAIAVDATRVFFAEDECADAGACMFHSGAIWSVPTSGKHAKKIATGLNTLALAADEANVYWADAIEGDGGASNLWNVMSTPTAGGGASATLASDQEYPRAIAVDSTSLYWGTEYCATDGGACTGSLVKLTPK
jgi:hypothetical protein